MPPLENATHLRFYVSKFPGLSRSGWLLLTASLPAALTLLARTQSKAAEPGGRQRLHLEKVPNQF